MNKLWKKFDKLSSESYTCMITGDADWSVWNETFAALIEAIEDERGRNSDFAKELYEVDDDMDYQCEVSGWLEDYLDELDMRCEYERLQNVCEKLLGMFQWEEDSPSTLRFQISSALQGQGKIKESLTFCEEWFQQEADNVYAATALTYAKIANKELDGAEDLIQKFISEDTECNDENDIIFTAAEKLYKLNGNKKEGKRIKQAIQKYEKELEEYYNDTDFEDLEFDDYF